MAETSNWRIHFLYSLQFTVTSEESQPKLAEPKRSPLHGGALFPSDLNSELKLRLKKSQHASVSNLKQSQSLVTPLDTVSQSSTMAPVATSSLCVPPSSASSSDTDEGKDLGKLLRSFSKENMSSNVNKVNKVLVNISKRLSNVAAGTTNESNRCTPPSVSTSEGESSGGREVSNIIKNSAIARRKKQTDGWVKLK